MTEFRKYLNEEHGRITSLAREFNITVGAVWQWAEGQVPAERLFKVSKITGISLEKLRPDLFDRRS